MLEIFQPTQTPASLEIRYQFKASVEDLFQAWTDPSILTQWFRVHPSFTTPIAEVDLQEGGHYRLGMKNPDGEEMVAFGEYQLIDEPNKLVFTWNWESSPPDSLYTLVTIDFHKLEKGTEIILRHESFVNEEQRDSHLEGWQGCFEQLIQIKE